MPSVQESACRRLTAKSCVKPLLFQISFQRNKIDFVLLVIHKRFDTALQFASVCMCVCLFYLWSCSSPIGSSCCHLVTRQHFHLTLLLSHFTAVQKICLSVSQSATGSLCAGRKAYRVVSKQISMKYHPGLFHF